MIRTILLENPTSNRTKISCLVCKHFKWIQPNGFLRDMVCRSLLLCLERAGHITLPERRSLPYHMQQKKTSIIQTELPLFSDDTTPLQGTIKQLGHLSVQQVRRTGAEKEYKNLINNYHYLHYCQPVGEHLKYVIYSGKRPIACISFSSAPRHIGCRDRFIGWDQNIRRKNISLIAYNTRFLILPWVQVPHLASHLLGRMSRRICSDWKKVYNHPVYYLETFVDTERFAGTCYKAANWIYLGKTTGRGKNDHTYKQNRSIKAVWGYPLTADFREKLLNG